MHRSACVLTGHPASREAEGRSGGHAIASGILITFHAKPPVSPPYARVSAIRYLSRRRGPTPAPVCVAADTSATRNTDVRTTHNLRTT